jgi:hydrogenase maturation protease
MLGKVGQVFSLRGTSVPPFATESTPENGVELIIGYGNPLRGDDGFGYRAAERIPGGIAVHQLTPELMDLISRADRVVFLDATAEGVPGEIHRRPLAPAASGRPFAHHATPETLLAGALALYGRAPEAILVTVTGGNFAVSDSLSSEVEAALDRVLEEVLRVSSVSGVYPLRATPR